MRHADGSGLTVQERARREQIRLMAAEHVCFAVQVVDRFAGLPELREGLPGPGRHPCLGGTVAMGPGSDDAERGHGQLLGVATSGTQQMATARPPKGSSRQSPRGGLRPSAKAVMMAGWLRPIGRPERRCGHRLRPWASAGKQRHHSADTVISAISSRWCSGSCSYRNADSR